MSPSQSGALPSRPAPEKEGRERLLESVAMLLAFHEHKPSKEEEAVEVGRKAAFEAVKKLEDVPEAHRDPGVPQFVDETDHAARPHADRRAPGRVRPAALHPAQMISRTGAPRERPVRGRPHSAAINSGAASRRPCVSGDPGSA